MRSAVICQGKNWPTYWISRMALKESSRLIAPLILLTILVFFFSKSSMVLISLPRPLIWCAAVRMASDDSCQLDTAPSLVLWKLWSSSNPRISFHMLQMLVFYWPVYREQSDKELLTSDPFRDPDTASTSAFLELGQDLVVCEGRQHPGVLDPLHCNVLSFVHEQSQRCNFITVLFLISRK